MFDIEIIDDRQVALVTPDSPGTRMLKAFNSALMMKRLGCTDGEVPHFKKEEAAKVCSRQITTNFERDFNTLYLLGLIDYSFKRWPSADGDYCRWYSFTKFGIEVLNRLRDGEEEIQIPFYSAP